MTINFSWDNYLTNLSKLYSKKSQKFKYNSYHELLLNEGQEFNVISQDNYQLLTPKHCYYNCYNKVIESENDFFYCEGFVISKDVPIPISHAWLVNQNFEVIEVTLRNFNNSYFGIAFQTQWLKNLIENRNIDEYSVFQGNYLEQFSLLNGFPENAIIYPIIN